MNGMSQTLVAIASLALIAFVGEHFYQEYGRASALDLSCSSESVLGKLVEVSTSDLKEAAANEKYEFNATVPKETITTENRLATGQGRYKYSCNARVEVRLSKDGAKTVSGGRDVDYSVTENDAGTHFWVSAQQVTLDDLSAE